MTLLDLLKQSGIDFKIYPEHHHCTLGFYQLDCVQCDAKGHYRLGISFDARLARCWACGQLDLLETLHKLTGESYAGLRVLAGNSLHPERSEGDSHLLQGRRDQCVLPGGLELLRKVHRQYLSGRGLQPAELEEVWGIKGISLSSHLSWRVFIPITYKGKVVSWTTRSLRDGGVRYINCPKEHEVISAKEILYGEEKAGLSVIVCEGPFDVWRIGGGAVATFGTAVSKAQVLKLSRYPIRMVVFDSDAPGQYSAELLCEMLSVFPGTTKNVVLDAKDAGSASEREIQLLRRLLR